MISWRSFRRSESDAGNRLDESDIIVRIQEFERLRSLPVFSVTDSDHGLRLAVDGFLLAPPRDAS